MVAASRNFVCVRPASYTDADEASELQRIFRGRPEELENTVFALLAPDGKTLLERSSRSPRMTFGSLAGLLAAMERHAPKERHSKAEIRALPTYANLGLALNVASSDSRPLVVGHATSAKERQRLEQGLAEQAWSESFIGRYHYVVVEDSEELDVLEGASAESSVFVVAPGTFGLEGEVLVATDEPEGELVETLERGLELYEPVTKDPRQHVRSGRQSGQSWEREVPARDAAGESEPPSDRPGKGR